MNTGISNNISAPSVRPDQHCVFVPNGNSSRAVPAPANFNFNLQPYKFAAIGNEMENIADEKTKFDRFIAFGKSFAF